MKAHDTCQRVQVSHPQRVIAKQIGLSGQIHRIRSPPQERETRGQPQLDKGLTRVGRETALLFL